MKISLKQVEEVRKNCTEMQKEVLDYVERRLEDYTDHEMIFVDVLNHGCESGIVSEMIYFSDTIAFYERHKKEINEMLSTFLQETGFNINELFRIFDTEDFLCLEVHNKNLLAWFGFEQSLEILYNQFLMKQDRE